MSEPSRRAAARRLAVLAGAAAVGALSSPLVRAQAYPARPITLIAPYPPGGGVDTVARMFGERLAQRLGQAVTIDNKPGAGATLGATALARSPGHPAHFGTGTNTQRPQTIVGEVRLPSILAHSPCADAPECASETYFGTEARDGFHASASASSMRRPSASCRPMSASGRETANLRRMTLASE